MQALTEAMMDQIREEADRKIQSVREDPRFNQLHASWRKLVLDGRLDRDMTPIDMILSADTVDDGFRALAKICYRAEVSEPNQIDLPY